VHAEEGLEDNQDPSYLRDLRLSRLTVEGFRRSEIISFRLACEAFALCSPAGTGREPLFSAAGTSRRSPRSGRRRRCRAFPPPRRKSPRPAAWGSPRPRSAIASMSKETAPGTWASRSSPADRCEDAAGTTLRRRPGHPARGVARRAIRARSRSPSSSLTPSNHVGLPPRTVAGLPRSRRAALAPR
jgi:hypothetical protein